MTILSRFQFRSITHRLVFVCVLAAIVIYSLSFWHMRQLTQQGLMNWAIQLAQSNIDAVAAEVQVILQSVEQNASVVRAELQTKYALNESDLPLLQTLMAQQSVVQAVATVRLPTKSSATIPSRLFGLRTDHQGTYQALGDRDITTLVTRCQNTSTATQPFWTKPYQRSPANESLSTIYCVPLSQTLDPARRAALTPRAVLRYRYRQPGKSGMLAIEITLDWIKKLAQSKLQVVDRFFNLPIGQPFIVALPTKQWLLSPSVSIKNLSWFYQKHYTALIRQSIWHEFPNASVPKIINDSQGTLVFITLPSNSLTVGIAFSASDIWLFVRNYIFLIIGSMGKDMILMCVAIALVSQQTTRPLRALITSTDNIARGNIDTVLPVISQRDEVGKLGKSFRHMRDALKTHIQELQETTAAKQKMESELSIASQIQRSMLPKIEVALGPDQRYEISALLQPARIVGGDLYDFFLMGEDRLCIVIGDVADKGVAAALLMAQTVTLIRTMAKQTFTPIEILCAVNRELCTNNEECLFVTLFCGVLKLQTGILHYASGGHDAPLLVRSGRAGFLDLETGPPLGLEDEAIFPQSEYLLQQNDLIVLYTDGITEAINLKGELFSEARLLDTLAGFPPSNPALAIRTIEHFHRQFVADAPQSDDITLLALQYQPLSPFLKEMENLEWTISINSELTELEKVKQRLGEILQEKGLAVESIEDAQLIAEEVLVNIIEYGDAKPGHQCIEFQVKISYDSLRMTFEDWGKPFNPLTEIDTPDLSMDDERRSDGGLGFYLVRELADRIDYIHQDGKNILNIFKTIAKPRLF